MKNQRLATIMLTGLMASLLATSAAVEAKTTLTLLFGNRPNYVTWIDAVIEAFEEEHPDIDVEVIYSSIGPSRQLPVMIAGGTPPDLSLSDPYVVIDLARQGLLEDLGPWVEKDAQHFADWLPPALQMVRFQGLLYALPQDLQVYAVYYNADAYNASGLAPPSEDWTYDEFAENARRLYVEDEHGEALRHGSMLPGWRSWVIPVWAYGGDFVDSWGTPTRFVGHSDEVHDGLHYLKDLVDTRAIMDRVTNSRWNPNNAFMEQRIGMYMQNSITTQAFRDIESFEWDVAPVPVGPAGRVTTMNALSWFILKSTPHKEETWTLLRYITSPKALEMLVEIVGVVPPNRKVLLDKWMTTTEMPANRQYFLTGIETARPGIGALAADVYTPIGEEGLAVVWGDKPITAALEQMEQRVNAAIAELNR